MTAQLLQLSELRRLRVRGPQKASTASASVVSIGRVFVAEAPATADDLDAAKPRMAWWAPLLIVGLAIGGWAIFWGAGSFARALLTGA